MRISDWSSDVCSSDLADKITVDGTSLRFSDATYSGLMTGGGASFASLGASAGALVAVTGYANAAVLAGTAYGSEASGLRDRKSVVQGKSGSVRRNHGGRRILKKKTKTKTSRQS